MQTTSSKPPAQRVIRIRQPAYDGVKALRAYGVERVASGVDVLLVGWNRLSEKARREAVAEAIGGSQDQSPGLE